MNKRICVLGGDLRQETVCDLLIKDGFSVDRLGLSGDECNFDCLKNCDILILPVPASYDYTYVNAPLFGEKIKLSYIAEILPRSCFVLGGCLTYEVKALFESRGIEYCDYYNREELVIKNAIPTAEGAMEIAMSEMPITIFGSNALVIGYGRIGKILSERLKAFGAKVMVSARNHRDFAWIEERGYIPVHTEGITEYMGDFDVIFNTVPKTVLERRQLEKVRNDALIIDLASKPGGAGFYLDKVVHNVRNRTAVRFLFVLNIKYLYQRFIF